MPSKQSRQQKKPRSGVPNDKPKAIIQDFAPELAGPVSKIINSIAVTGEWPSHWKIEHIVPIPKVAHPKCENDLRPISLTPFLSKVAEKIVVKWLWEFIGDKIDFRQYGGQKGNATSHYIIEFLKFILSCLDGSGDQTAVLSYMVDFEKAFMKQDHNILITKLSDMGVPGWLLKLVMSFLSDRKLLVLFKGVKSNVKMMPGGGPQGTLLALLLFLVLVNDLGFEGQLNNAGSLAVGKRSIRSLNVIHLKYVDDLTLAEATNLPEKLLSQPVNIRPQPHTFHARTGHYTYLLERAECLQS